MVMTNLKMLAYTICIDAKPFTVFLRNIMLVCHSYVSVSTSNSPYTVGGHCILPKKFIVHKRITFLCDNRARKHTKWQIFPLFTLIHHLSTSFLP